jgi:hypothetical protein
MASTLYVFIDPPFVDEGRLWPALSFALIAVFLFGFAAENRH